MISKKWLATCLLIVVVSVKLGVSANSIGSHSLASAFTREKVAPNDQQKLSIEKVDQHCTVFYAADDGVALGGNNEDGYHPALTRIWFVPPEDVRFGLALVGFDNFSEPEGAVNDQG